MTRLFRRVVRLLNVALGRIVNSALAAGLAAFGGFAFYQAVIEYEVSDSRGALFLALFGCTLMSLAAVNLSARETLTESLKEQNELTLGWRLLTALSKRR